MDEPLRELNARIAAFLERHAMAPTRFGRDATGDANLVSRLLDGRSPSLRTVGKCDRFMAEYEAERAASPGKPDKAARTVNGCSFGACPADGVPA